ncbi:uncharacterized protein PG986_011638 [Apiospora aurea]|uniref:Ankyrin repeat protein n=1 Tax=Apiospora aurea TaxID=335848 RepID=A0ABR1PXQ8_9PEZI
MELKSQEGRTLPNIREKGFVRWRTVFDRISPESLSMRNLAFQLGFRDIDFDPHCGCFPPLCSSGNLDYVNWLLQHGADLKRLIWSSGDRQSQANGLTSAHYLLYRIFRYPIDFLQPSRHQTPDYVFCQMLQITTEALSVGLADVCFDALGLTHTCCDARRIVEYQHCYQTKDRDEVDEIQQEESVFIEVLDDMVAEFEDVTSHISDDTTQSQFQECWEGYWVNRVPEILQELEDSRMTEAERQGAEMIGVVWESESESDDPTEQAEVITGNPYYFGDINYWYYVLDSIAGDI